jgi:hypothetical protein
MSVTLAEIRTAALQRANREVDTGVADEDRFVTNAEIDALINRGYRELYGYLIRHGMHRSESVYEIEADGSLTYDLPDDFFATLVVFRVEDGVGYTMGRHDHRVRARADLGDVPAHTYRIVGTSIEFDPVPTDGDYEVRYVPLPGELSADDDEMDNVLGWEEYVVLYVAAKLLQKEGSFNAAAALRSDARELLVRIEDEAQAAEMTEGTTIARVRTAGATPVPGDFGGGGRPGFWWYRW